MGAFPPNTTETLYGGYSTGTDLEIKTTPVGVAGSVRIGDVTGKKVTINGLTGAVELESGDLTITAGSQTITAGNLTVALGSIAATAGNVTAGKRLITAKSANVAGASTFTVGTGNYVVATGVTAIDYITTTGWAAGSSITIEFSGAGGVNHNTGTVPTNTAACLLTGDANFTAAAGDTITLAYNGTNWVETGRGSSTVSGDLAVSGDVSVGDRLLLTKGATITSGSAVAAGDGNYFIVSGATRLDHINGSGWTAGSVIELEFSGAGGLNHNTGAPPALHLPIFVDGAESYTATVGDVVTLAHNGAAWVEIGRRSGTVNGSVTIPTGALNVTTGDATVGGDVSVGDRLLLAQGVDVTSASAVVLGDGNYFDVTGTTPIDHISTVGWPAGSVVTLQFDSPAAGVNNFTGGAPANHAPALLAGGRNFVAALGDTITLCYDGASWREVARKRARIVSAMVHYGAAIAAEVVSIKADAVVAGGVITVIGQPDYPRTLQVGITDADASITAGKLTLTGTDASGKAITEDIALTGGTAVKTTGLAFAHVDATSAVSLLAGNDGADKISVGVGASFGVPIDQRGALLGCHKINVDDADEAVAGVSTTYGTIAPTSAPNAVHVYDLFYTYSAE